LTFRLSGPRRKFPKLPGLSINAARRRAFQHSCDFRGVRSASAFRRSGGAPIGGFAAPPVQDFMLGWSTPSNPRCRLWQ
jgi:hypothetical protein